jgi:hypothetical protein
MKTLLKFSSVHVQVYNHFNQERYLITRQVYKADTLDRIDGMARPFRVRRRLRAGVSRYASADAVTLTTPSQRHAAGRRWRRQTLGGQCGREVGDDS